MTAFNQARHDMLAPETMDSATARTFQNCVLEGCWFISSIGTYIAAYTIIRIISGTSTASVV
jgi:hypothetical protein